MISIGIKKLLYTTGRRFHHEHHGLDKSVTKILPRTCLTAPPPPSVLRSTSLSSTNVKRSSTTNKLPGFETNGLVYFNTTPQLSEEYDRQKQNKKANLGKIVEILQVEIPDILTTLISSDLISSDIVLRICPTTLEKVPSFKGYVTYVTTAKTLQLCLTQFILNPSVKVHVKKLDIVDPSKGEYTRYRGMIPDATKIIMKWKTCSENCPHLSLQNEETARGSRGKHTWSKLDHETAQSSKTFGLINLQTTDDKIERILSGVFIFELDESNETIKAITIEDVEILENKEWIETTGSAAC